MDAQINNIWLHARYGDLYASADIPEGLETAICGFVEDVEDNACAVINSLSFIGRSVGSDMSVRPSILAGPSRLKSHSLARHYVWFTLFHHPVTSGFVTKVSIGRQYARDHKTVCHGIRSVSALLYPRITHAWGRGYQTFAETLADYGEFDWRSCAASTFATKRAGQK